MLHNVPLEPDLFNSVYLSITLMDLVYNYLFHKGFCTVYYGDNKKNAVNMTHSAQSKHVFLVKTS